jgi:hypothetical protein
MPAGDVPALVHKDHLVGGQKETPAVANGLSQRRSPRSADGAGRSPAPHQSESDCERGEGLELRRVAEAQRDRHAEDECPHKLNEEWRHQLPCHGMWSEVSRRDPHCTGTTDRLHIPDRPDSACAGSLRRGTGDQTTLCRLAALAVLVLSTRPFVFLKSILFRVLLP